jgi:hypothetical protein
VTQPTADIGPIEEAAALTTLIERLRAELTTLVGRRRQKIDEARATEPATVAVIAQRVRLSPGRISQITTRRGRQVGLGNCRKGVAGVQAAAPDTPTTQEA